jgi:hypothetical protein
MRNTMKTKNSVLMGLFFILLAVTGCSTNGSTSRVSIDFDNGGASLSSMGVITSEGVTLKFSAITLTVSESAAATAGGTVLFSKVYTADELASSGSISIEVPAGTDRYFEAAASDATTETTGTPAVVEHVTCSGTEGPVALEADVETNVSITLTHTPMNKDAALTVTLNSDTFKPAEYGTTVVSTIHYGIFIPVIKDDGTVSIDEENPITEVTQDIKGGQTSIPALDVYPDTYQLLIIKAYADDGGVSFLGGAPVSTLVSGSNGVTVTMSPASKVFVTIPGYIKGQSITLTETMYNSEGTAVDAPLTYELRDDGIQIFAYSGRFTSGDANGVRRILNLTYGGVEYYSQDYAASNALGWGQRTWTAVVVQ